MYSTPLPDIGKETAFVTGAASGIGQTLFVDGGKSLGSLGA